MILKRKDGFTLIELVIVLVVLAFLALGVNAFIGDTISTKAYGTARKIQSDIIYAQEQAMTHRVHYRVTFTSSPNGYTVQQCSSSCIDIIDPSTTTSPFTVTLNAGNYSGVSWTATTFSGNYIEFNSAGIPLDANTSCGTAPCSITATESVALNSGTRSVSVTSGTGKTTVY